MSLLAKARTGVTLTLRRNIGFSAIVAQKAADPVQQLFIQSIKEYAQKSKSAGGKLVDSNPETEKELKSELDRIAKVFGGSAGADMTKFPTFNFKEPQFDPIDSASK